MTADRLATVRSVRDGAELRPCRACTAYAVQAARWGLPVVNIERATVEAYWPPSRLAYIFPQCREAVVWVCAWHRRGYWPISLYLALATETEDLTMTTMNVSGSALDAILAGKGTRMPRPKRSYGAWPGEDVAADVAAFREAKGNASAAGRLLDQRGVPTRRAAKWQPQTVAWIVEMQGA